MREKNQTNENEISHVCINWSQFYKRVNKLQTKQICHIQWENSYSLSVPHHAMPALFHTSIRSKKWKKKTSKFPVNIFKHFASFSKYTWIFVCGCQKKKAKKRKRHKTTAAKTTTRINKQLCYYCYYVLWSSSY